MGALENAKDLYNEAKRLIDEASTDRMMPTHVYEQVIIRLRLAEVSASIALADAAENEREFRR